MKKLLTLVLVLTLAFSLAACGSKKEETASNNSDIEAETEINGEEITDVTEEKEEVLPQEPSEENENKPASPDEKPQTKPQEKPKPASPEEKPQTKPQEEPKPAPEDKPADETPKTVGNSLFAEFKKLASSGNSLAIAEKLAESQILSEMSMGAVSVEPGYLNGFDNAEITGFSEGAMFCPMIGSIPFVGYVFTLAEGTDASEFISFLKSSANLRWNICTEAEEMVAGSSGDKVFFVMCNKSLKA